MARRRENHFVELPLMNGENNEGDENDEVNFKMSYIDYQRVKHLLQKEDVDVLY
jgi:hypothetical protein